MRVLLTGASGFLGRNFILRAPEDWRIVGVYNASPSFVEFAATHGNGRVTTVKCDLADAEQVADLSAQHGSSWDCCVYLAANVDLPGSVHDPIRDWRFHVGALLNLLSSASFKRFVFLSSGAVYDGLRGHVDPSRALSPTLPYAISKLASEHYIKTFRHRRSTLDSYSIVRFFGAYGPYETSSKIYTKLTRAFAFERQTDFTIYGSGENLIDAMYVDDAIAALQLVVTREHHDVTVDLCSGAPLSIEGLVTRAANAFGVGAVRILRRGESSENIHFRAEPSIFQSMYGWAPSVPLEVGLAKLAKHLAHNLEPRLAI